MSNEPVRRQLVATYLYPCLGRFPPSTAFSHLAILLGSRLVVHRIWSSDLDASELKGFHQSVLSVAPNTAPCAFNMKNFSPRNKARARTTLRGLPTNSFTQAPASVSAALPTGEQSLAGRAAVDRASPSSAVEPKTGTTTSTKHSCESDPRSVRLTSPEAPTSTSTSAGTATPHQGSTHTHNSSGGPPSREPTSSNSAVSATSRLSQLLLRRQPSSGRRSTLEQDALSPKHTSLDGSLSLQHHPHPRS